MMEEMIREAERVFDSPLQYGDRTLAPGRFGGVYTLRLLLTRLLMELFNGASQSDAREGRSRRAEPEEEQMIQSVIALMRANLRGELRFADLCRSMGMSATAVKQMFRRRFETTPMAYYEQLRMSEARRRLREGGKSISAVADEMGFSSPSYFSARFRRVNGMSPREFLSGLEP